MLENPYDILGLHALDSLETIKSRYKELARQNHPDKLYKLSEKERNERENYFKKVTVAYHTIIAHKMENPETEDNVEEGFRLNDLLNRWQGLWNTMSKVENWSEIFQNTLHDVASMIQRHSMKVPVKLSEIHEKKVKKVRMLLRGMKEPVYVTIHCGDFPKSINLNQVDVDGIHHRIHVEMFVDEENQWLDDEGGHHHQEIIISWSEYITGITKEIRKIDGTITKIIVPPFSEDFEVRYIGEGIVYNGIVHDWIIHAICKPPTLLEWSNEKNRIINA